MPGLVAPLTDEREVLLAFLGQQRDALRYAAHGLTDEQASTRSTVSELCLAGLIKHAALVERAWISFLVTGDTTAFVPQEDWANGFLLVGGETLDDVLAMASAQARDTEKVIGNLPDVSVTLAPTADVVPWIPAGVSWTPRWILLHLIEETARHAGHADIIREAFDGSTCWTLMAAAEGWSMSDWS
jgi:hypothetical protein